MCISCIFLQRQAQQPLQNLLTHGRDYWEPKAVDECDYHTENI